jgi:hypothetical protein
VFRLIELRVKCVQRGRISGPSYNRNWYHTVERLMTSKRVLERAGPAELAVLCQRVADDPGAYLADAASEASKLKLELEKLQSPPSLNVATQRQIESQKDHLARRMVKFLAEVL